MASEHKNPPNGMNCERRHFLQWAALTAAGTSSALLSGTAAPTGAAPRDICEGKAPLREVVDKVAFITGGSSGIGLGIARAFVEAGMKVAIGYRTAKHRDEAMTHFGKAAGRVHAINVDVTDRPGMKKAAEETRRVFGKVHVLVNNAGVGTLGPLSKTTYDDWDWVLGVNITGVFNGVHAFLPHIQAHGEGGHIMATSSIFGLVALNNWGGYSASKYAVVGLMETLRGELSGSNIGVSVYCPGPVSSAGLGAVARNRPRELGDVGVQPDPTMIAQDEAIRHDSQYMMDPLEVGRLVLRGMRRNDLYIFTHPEFEGLVQDRNEALLVSIPRDLQPTEKRLAVATSLRSSIYTAERDRKRCAGAKPPAD